MGCAWRIEKKTQRGDVHVLRSTARMFPVHTTPQRRNVHSRAAPPPVELIWSPCYVYRQRLPGERWPWASRTANKTTPTGTRCTLCRKRPSGRHTERSGGAGVQKLGTGRGLEKLGVWLKLPRGRAREWLCRPTRADGDLHIPRRNRQGTVCLICQSERVDCGCYHFSQRQFRSGDLSPSR